MNILFNILNLIKAAIKANSRHADNSTTIHNSSTTIYNTTTNIYTTTQIEPKDTSND